MEIKEYTVFAGGILKGWFQKGTESDLEIQIIKKFNGELHETNKKLPVFGLRHVCVLKEFIHKEFDYFSKELFDFGLSTEVRKSIVVADKNRNFYLAKPEYLQEVKVPEEFNNIWE